VLHRAGLTHNAAAALADGGTGGVDVVDADGDVAIASANLVGGGVPIVGELQDGAVVFLAIAHESEGEAALGVVTAP
jgi:hypothetical protein